jgi:hypothetical protein
MSISDAALTWLSPNDKDQDKNKETARRTREKLQESMILPLPIINNILMLLEVLLLPLVTDAVNVLVVAILIIFTLMPGLGMFIPLRILAWLILAG